MASVPSRAADPYAGRDDSALVRAALAGSDPAIEAVLARLSCIVRFVFKLNRTLGYRLPTEVLEDVVQQVYAALWPRLRDYVGGASLESWAFGFCRNCLRAEARRRASRLRLVRGGEEADALARAQPDAADEPCEQVQRAERLDALHEVLQELPDDEREVVELRHLHDWSFERIARERGIAPSTVKDRCYRAMTRLQRLLRQRDEAIDEAGSAPAVTGGA
ncbi:MAG: sigma-70 family RNA polymerase sigma factor [Planctomycetes bacterium]|nr:sigma-70 family RNA polymerase sigma factor [Planctomycetota bacterium]